MVYKIPSPTTQITVKRSLIYPLKNKKKKKKVLQAVIPTQQSHRH